ncbi:Ldh family oxidoreductase [haloarchaeon 3A1-DGR]|nr:Ldh family oxidoreductase [haloarchaeon 3A1-DGR]
MPTVDPNELEELARRSIEGYGADPEIAATVAKSLVAADLVGHSSHGVVRVPYYADIVAEGGIDPTAEPTVESAGPFHQVVGGAAFGQLTGRQAIELLLETTEERGVGVVGIRDSGHLGRIGEWADRVTEEGYLFASWVNLQGGAQRIAPHGSADRRLGTNPLTFAVPTFDALPFDLLLDGATSQVAHGKIIEREGSGERLPEAWTITDSGGPVETAEDFENYVGALLPLGGRETGYKGFGLATIAELFAAIVGDGPVSTEPDQNWAGNGGAFIAIDPEQFTTREAIETRVTALAEHIRSADTIDDEDEIVLPGEPEYRTAHRHRQEGLPVEEAVADDLRQLAAELDIESSVPTALRAD